MMEEYRKMIADEFFMRGLVIEPMVTDYNAAGVAISVWVRVYVKTTDGMLVAKYSHDFFGKEPLGEKVLIERAVARLRDSIMNKYV